MRTVPSPAPAPTLVAILAATSVLVACGGPTPPAGGEHLWTRQFGSAEADGASASTRQLGTAANERPRASRSTRTAAW